jgi:hypothetical protein
MHERLKLIEEQLISIVQYSARGELTYLVRRLIDVPATRIAEALAAKFVQMPWL